MNTRLTVQAVAAFNAGKIEQSGLLFWRAAHLAPSYCSLHNYAVYLSGNALYIPIGGGKYAAIKKQPSILYYLKRAQRLATIPHWKTKPRLATPAICSAGRMKRWRILSKPCSTATKKRWRISKWVYAICKSERTRLRGIASGPLMKPRRILCGKAAICGSACSAAYS